MFLEYDALSDGALLELFARHDDASAFEKLVARHGDMVRATCHGVLGSWAEAEDASQAVFIVLVRKARRLEKRESLAGWLYHVALCTARNERKARQRRAAREQRGAALMRFLRETQSDGDACTLRTLLGEALDALPAKFREPIVLHHLEQLSYRDAARRMGCSEKAFCMRLVRGRERLKRRMQHSCPGVTLASISALLATGTATSKAGAALSAQGMAALAVSTQAGGLSAASAGVAALTQSTLLSLAVAPAKACAAVCAVALGAGAVTGAAIQAVRPAIGEVAKRTVARHSGDDDVYRIAPNPVVQPAGGALPAGIASAVEPLLVPPTPAGAPRAEPPDDPNEDPPGAPPKATRADPRDPERKDPDKGVRKLRGVPQNAEMERLLAKAGELLAEGRYTEAAPFLQQALDRREPAVVPVGEGSYRSVRGVAEAMLRRLPPDGLSAYRMLADPSAKRLLPDGRRSERSALQAVCDRFFFSSVGDVAAIGLADALLLESRAVAALWWLRRVQEEFPNPSVSQWELLAKLFAAAAQAGEREAALTYGRQCAAPGTDVPDAVRQAVAAQLETLQAAAPRAPSPPSHTETVPYHPKSGGGPDVRTRHVWTPKWETPLYHPHGLSAKQAAVILQRREGHLTPAQLRTMGADAAIPALRILPQGSNLFARAYGHLFCLSAETGSVRWRVADPCPDDIVQPVPAVREAGTIRDFFRRRLDATIAAAGDAVLCLENTSDATPTPSVGYGPRTQNPADRKVIVRPAGNGLTARRAASGDLLWRAGRTTEKSDPLASVTFLNAPQAVGNRLIVPGLNMGRLVIAVLSADSGETLAVHEVGDMLLSRHVDMFNPQSGFHVEDTLAILLPDDLGHVMGIDWETGDIAWAYRYHALTDGQLSISLPSVGARGNIRFRRARGMAKQEQSGWSENRVCMAGDTLLAFPAAASSLVALDARNGTLRYELDLVDPVSVVGIVEGQVYVTTRTRALCVDSAEGTTRWTTPLPATPARGALDGDTLYIPCINSIVEIDRRTGRSMRALVLGAADMPFIGNLVVRGDMLYAAGPRGVVGLQRRAANPELPPAEDDASGALRGVAALDALLARDPSPPEQALAEAEVFARICEGLQADVDDPAWAQRAHSLATNETMRMWADYAAWCRRARVDDPLPCARRLGELLLQGGRRLVSPEPMRSTQSGRLLAAHLQHALSRLDGEAKQRLLQTWGKAVSRTTDREQLRYLGDVFAGTEPGLEAARRAAEAFREAGMTAAGEVILINAVEAASHDLAKDALAALRAYYTDCRWPTAATRVDDVTRQLEALAEQHPSVSVARLIRVLQQRPERPAGGSPRWREVGVLTDKRTELIAFSNPWRTPFYEDHAVFIEARKRLVCVDLASRKRIWELETEEPHGFSTDLERGLAASARHVVNHGHIAIFHEGTATIAVDLLRGRRLWTQSLGCDPEQPGAFISPVLTASRGAVIARIGRHGASRIEARDILDGATLWTVAQEAGRASRAYDAGDVVAAWRKIGTDGMAWHDAATGKSRGFTRLEQHGQYNVDYLLAPNGMVLRGSRQMFTSPGTYRRLSVRAMVRPGQPDPVWLQTLADRQHSLWLLDSDRFMVRGGNHVQALQLETGEPVWTWDSGSGHVLNVVCAHETGATARVLHVGGTESGLAAMNVSDVDVSTGTATPPVELVWTDPRLRRVPQFVSVDPAYAVVATYLPRQNQRAAEREWTFRAYDTHTGEAIDDIVELADGVRYSAMSVMAMAPQIVVQRRYALLVTHDSIRLFEKVDRPWEGTP